MIALFHELTAGEAMEMPESPAQVGWLLEKKKRGNSFDTAKLFKGWRGIRQSKFAKPLLRGQAEEIHRKALKLTAADVYP